MASSLSEQMTHELGTQSIFRLLLRFSIPSLISNFLFTIYNVVDRVFISWKLGTDAISGVGITFYLFMIFIAVGMMFGIGGFTLVSLKLGEQYKATSHDVNFLMSVYSKKNRKALTVTCANHRYFRNYLAEVCHRIVTGKTYELDFKTKKDN